MKGSYEGRARLEFEMRFVGTIVAAILVVNIGGASSEMSVQCYAWIMTGRQVVPATASPGIGGTTMIFADGCESSADSAQVEVFYRGLLGRPTRLSIRRDIPGTNGERIIFRAIDNDERFLLGFPEEDCASLLDGDLFALIETDVYPSGEIAGRIQCEVTAVGRVTWGRVKSMYR